MQYKISFVIQESRLTKNQRRLEMGQVSLKIHRSKHVFKSGVNTYSRSIISFIKNKQKISRI